MDLNGNVQTSFILVFLLSNIFHFDYCVNNIHRFICQLLFLMAYRTEIASYNPPLNGNSFSFSIAKYNVRSCKMDWERKSEKKPPKDFEVGHCNIKHSMTSMHNNDTSTLATNSVLQFMLNVKCRLYAQLNSCCFICIIHSLTEHEIFFSFAAFIFFSSHLVMHTPFPFTNNNY